MRRPMVALATAAAIAAAGCGGGPAVSTSTVEAKVTGAVRLKGKPVTKGTITFDPSNYQRKSAAPRGAPIGKDGTYEVTTLVGQNTVTVGGLGANPAAPSAYPPQQFEVKEGANTFDLDLDRDAP